MHEEEDKYWYCEDDDSTLPYHYWIEKELDEYLDPNKHILCMKMTDKKLCTGAFLNVTINVADTTCQECLEWLHA